MSEIASIVPRRKSRFAEPVTGAHTTLSGIDVLERVVEVEAQGCLPQAAHHPVSHYQPLGEIDGRRRVAVVRGCLPVAARPPVGHRQTLRRIH